MKKLFLVLYFLLFIKANAQEWKTDEQYIQNFARYAVEAMEKYKIPASIKLAQGLLETGGGQSRLAKEGNNHFGIKCKEEWTGRTMKHNDDAPNECFRVYDDPRKSYEDHSIFLATRKYYVKLFDLDTKDYKGWAHGLKKAGYATNPRYAWILINLIEKHKLYEFDHIASHEVLTTLVKLYPNLNLDSEYLAKLQTTESKNSESKPKTIRVTYQQTSYAKQQEDLQKQLNTTSVYSVLNSILVKNHPNGGLKYFVVPQDIELHYVAQKFGVSESKLQRWNELKGTQLKKNDIVFLEAKSNSGNVATYQAEEGENMHTIAQKFAIRLDRLYAKNRMQEGDQPKAGEILYLQERKPRN